MDEGKMIEYGPPRTLFSAPQTEITRRLVESHFGKILDENAWINN